MLKELGDKTLLRLPEEPEPESGKYKDRDGFPGNR